MTGVAALHRATGDPSLREYMRSFGERYHWDFCNSDAGNPDNQICAASYADLYLTSPPSERNAAWLAPTIAHYEAEMAARPPYDADRWRWVDTLFMGMSVYARIANITGDPRYAQQAFKNFDFAAGSQGYQFWSQRDSLFYRDPPKWGQAYVPEGVYWSRGNGWAMGALVTALQFSGPADPHRAVYEGVFKRQAARLLRLQGARGCWPVSLTRPEADPAPETTGTALFAYGMAWGVRAGVLDAAEYGPALERAWGCLSGTSLQQSGLVGYCQPVGDRPGGGGGANATSSFCVGQFLLAASALAQIAPQ